MKSVNSRLDNKKPFSGKIFLLLTRFMFAISRKHTRNDFRVAILFPDKNQKSTAFSKIDQALGLISQYDPDRYRNVQRDVKRIWVSAAPGGCAEWNHELQMCTLDNEYFFEANPSPAEIAASIVHEATHAHLHNIGMDYTEEARARMEKLCFEAEIAFAKRLPDSEGLIKNAEARLRIPETFWTNDEFVQRNLDNFSELGKKSAFARLLYPIVKWLVNSKRARHD